MCGIIGVACSGAMGIPQKEFFQSLLFHDVVRGHHATGIAAIDTHTKQIQIAKAAVPSPLFLDSQESNELFAHKHNFNIYIGHNRYATSGDKTKDEYAHPFHHGDIVGVHNGSLRDQTLLEDHREFVVDSENIFYHMDIHGLDDTLTKLNGAFALVWYDSSDNSLNFIRNSERPLAVAKLSGNVWVWASEIGMLRWLVKRHKFLKFEQIESDANAGDKEDYCYHLTQGHHFKIPFNGRNAQKPLLIKKELTDFPIVSWSREVGGYNGYSRQDYSRPVNSNVSNLYGEGTRSPINICLSKLTNKLKINDAVEVKLVEIIDHEQYNGTTCKTEIKRRFIFEYATHKDDLTRRIKFYNAGFDPFCARITDANIGEFYYGTVSHAYEYNSSSPEEASNPVPGAASNDKGICVTIYNLRTISPQRYMGYNIEADLSGLPDDIDVPPDVDSEDNDDTDGNTLDVVPEEKKPQAVIHMSKKERRKASKTGSLSSTATGVIADITSEIPKPPENTGVLLQLFNCKIDNRSMQDASKLSHYRCSNCDKPISRIALSSLFVVTQVDQKDKKKHPYVCCSHKCYLETKVWIKECMDQCEEGYKL